MDMQNALTGVGEVITETAVEAITETAVELMPKSMFDVLNEFFGTPVGHIAGKVILVAVVLALMAVTVRVINRAFAKLAERLRARNDPNATLVQFLRYVALAGAYFVAFSIIVSAVPALNAGVNKVLAAGGVLVVLLGVVGQEALGSVASGVMILLFKPFMVGDVINVVSAGVAGVVEDITLRHTVLRTIESKRVIVPNSTMNSAVIENFDYGEKHVCLTFEVGITYESNMERALALLAEEVGRHPSYLDVRTVEQKAAGAPLVTVRVNALDDSAVKLCALLWGYDNASTVGMRFDLYRAVKNRFDAEGIDFAYPHIHVVQ